MIRTQIQLTPEQAEWLKRKAARENKSMAELIRSSVDEMIQNDTLPNLEEIRKKAMLAAGKLKGPADLAENHDTYLSEVFDQ